MNKDKYPTYALVAVAGIALAVWAGLPASLLLFLLVCPLMMFFMMRGMHGGQNHTGNSGQQEREASGTQATQAAAPVVPRRLDGSHERIDHP